MEVGGRAAYRGCLLSRSLTHCSTFSASSVSFFSSRPLTRSVDCSALLSSCSEVHAAASLTKSAAKAGPAWLLQRQGPWRSAAAASGWRGDITKQRAYGWLSCGCFFDAGRLRPARFSNKLGAICTGEEGGGTSPTLQAPDMCEWYQTLGTHHDIRGGRHSSCLLLQCPNVPNGKVHLSGLASASLAHTQYVGVASNFHALHVRLRACRTVRTLAFCAWSHVALGLFTLVSSTSLVPINEQRNTK
jgi:hypothetical protein